MNEPTISKAAAARIWNAHTEIENGEKVLTDIESHHDKLDATPHDPFGRRRDYTFGLPMGENSHRMINVSPTLSVYVVKAHIANMRKELTEACIAAKMELDGVVS